MLKIPLAVRPGASDGVRCRTPFSPRPGILFLEASEHVITESGRYQCPSTSAEEAASSLPALNCSIASATVPEAPR